MDLGFSVDDMDNFWGNLPSLFNGSYSEWCFQRFFQEDLNSISAHNSPPQKHVVEENHVPVDILSNKLDMASKPVAPTPESGTMPQETAAVAPDIMCQLPAPVQIISQASPAGAGTNIPETQGKGDGGATGKPSLQASQKKPCVQVMSTTSGSSQNWSDNGNEAEGHITKNVDPVDAKLMKRKLANRISAQRSRRRQKNQQIELEMQVSQLNEEHAALLKQLSVSSQKYNQAAVDNRILKANLETLRAKVKMAEETVKRITGFNPHLRSKSEILKAVMPSYAGGSSDVSTNAVASIQDNPKQHYHSPPNNHNLGIPNLRVDIVPVDSVQHPIGESATVAGANKAGTPSSTTRG